MAEQNKAIHKMAQRVMDGYEAVHNKQYDKGKQLLEPLLSFLHQEEKPNVTLLCYVAISQIGSKDIDNFLKTFEELQKHEPKNNKEAALKERVEKMFEELMGSLSDNLGE
ncbi:hypothetical protein ACERII_00780 [Evansella sp. AB-rgal1]|uniref:hypothetical protein n=1 Tax=Evansella sp. AB-rgal1 TaxID=3242696 RepID=UPI00359D1507